MSSAVTRRIQSAWVWSRAGETDTPHGSSNKIATQAATGPVKTSTGDRYGYVWCPFGVVPIGATATSVKITLYTWYATTVDTTVRIARPIKSWSTSRVTWRTHPDADPAIPYVSHVVPAGTPKGAAVTIDVTELVAPSILGEMPWLGIRLSASSRMEWHSELSEDLDKRPSVRYVWSDVPDAPTGLRPDDGAVSKATPTFSWDHKDFGGDKTIKAVRVQISRSASMTSPVYDSGSLPSTNPSHTPTAAAFTAAGGVTYYWRAQHTDGEGLVSEWSEVADFTYKGLPTLTVIGFENDLFTDPTPLITADMPGMTSWMVRVWLNGKAIYSTGWEDGNEIVWRLPKGVIRYDDRRYTFGVYGRDSVDRASAPGAPTYASKIWDSVYDNDPRITKVLWTAAKALTPRPGVRVSWERTAPADQFVIFRDGEIIATVDAEDVLDYKAGAYAWTDRYVAGGEHIYHIRCVEGSRSSVRAVGATVTSRPYGRWLITSSGTQVPIFDMGEVGEHGLELRESVEEVPLANGAIAVVDTGFGGYAGEVRGVVGDAPVGYGSLTLEQCEEAIKRIRLEGKARYIISTLSIPVQVLGVNLTRSHPEHARQSAVSMRVIQDGEEDVYGLEGGWQ